MLNAMETRHEIDVTNLDSAHRRAFEDVIGQQLRLNQRLVINVTETEARKAKDPRAQSLADWTHVYEGLTNEQIEAIDHNVKTRANLTRT
jgi:hypothetical protein